LSSLLEKNIRQGMNYSFNGVSDFFTRPVSLAFILVGVLVLVLHTVLPAVKAAKAKKAGAAAEEAPEE
jgi:TctA family transporter